MQDDGKVWINGRAIDEERLVSLCGRIASMEGQGHPQAKNVQRRLIHELGRLIGVGVATTVAQTS